MPSSAVLRLRALVLLVFGFGLQAVSSAQAGARKAEAPDTFPLGGIEALVLPADEGVRVQLVHDKGLAAKGGLEVGDIILAVQGRKLTGLPAERVDAIAAAIEAAEASVPSGKKLGQIEFDVVPRSGAALKRLVPVRNLGAHAATCPANCKRCELVLSEALDYLAGLQSGEGNLPSQSANPNQGIVTACMAGLAWLGHPQSRKRYAENIKNAADFVMRAVENSSRNDRLTPTTAGAPNWNQTNWSYAYATIFLAELNQQKPRADLKKAIGAYAQHLCATQEQSGGWAHGPGGINALDYLELEIMSNFALAAIGMAERSGLAIDEARKLKGIEWVRRCTTENGVSYSPLEGQAGFGDPGRTAGAFWAMRLCNVKGDLPTTMETYIRPRMKEFYESHACPTMHVLNGALAASVMGQADWTEWWRIWRPFLMASRTTKGAFDCRPNHESIQIGHPDRSWGDSFVTAHYAVAMQTGRGRYKLLEGGR